MATSFYNRKTDKSKQICDSFENLMGDSVLPLECKRASDIRKQNEKKVQRNVLFREAEVCFWIREMNEKIEALGQERKTLAQCVTSLKCRQAKTTILLSKAEHCLTIGAFQRGKRVALPGNEPYFKLYQEQAVLKEQILLINDAVDSCYRMQKSLEQEEMSVTEAFRSKVENICCGKLVPDLNAPSSSHQQDVHCLPQLGDPISWRMEVERKVVRSSFLLQQSTSVRRGVEEMLHNGEIVTCRILQRTTNAVEEEAKIESLRLLKHKTDLALVTADLVALKIMCNQLEEEATVQKTHEQLIGKRIQWDILGKPISEIVADESFLSMKEQVAKADKVATALRDKQANICRQICHKQTEVEELQRAVTLSTRKLFLYRDEIATHRRANTILLDKPLLFY